MARHLIRIMTALAALTLLSACSDTAAPPSDDTAVRGYVLDVQGRPVAGASIVLQYDVALVPGSEADKPQYGVRFDMAEPGRVHAWVAGFCDDDTVCTIIDMDLPSGSFTIIWNGEDDLGRRAPDGVYRMHVTWPAGQASNEFALAGNGYGALTPQESIAAAVVTDAKGAFRLETGCLPFGYEFLNLGESDLPFGRVAFTRRVRVWAFREGVVAQASDWITVDPEKGAAVTLTFAD